MSDKEQLDVEQPPAEGATCPRRPRARLILLALGIALWIGGTTVRSNAAAIAGTALSIVGFVSIGGA